MSSPYQNSRSSYSSNESYDDSLRGVQIYSTVSLSKLNNHYLDNLPNYANGTLYKTKPTDSCESLSEQIQTKFQTIKFQQINDAYYTLSDATRRRDYDVARNQFHGFPGGASSTRPGPSDHADEEIPRPEPGTMPGGFPWSAFGFGGNAKTEEDANRYSNEQFGSVFEEMMRDEGMADGNNSPTKVFWSSTDSRTVILFVSRLPAPAPGRTWSS